MCFFLKYVVDIKCNLFFNFTFSDCMTVFSTENMFQACRKVISVVNIVKLSIKNIFFHLATKSKSVSLNVQGCNRFSVIYKAGSGENFFKYWLLLAAIFPGRRTEQSCYSTWKCVTRKDFFVNHITKKCYKAVYAV